MLPSHIKIGPINYELELVERLQSNTDQSSILGNIREYDARMKLEKIGNPQGQLVVLIHEITHAILFQYGTEGEESINPDRKEGLVDAFSHGISQVLIDNPKLLELFRETANEYHSN